MDAQQRAAAATSDRPPARGSVVARLASYAAFRWLLRITLALALFQALLQWVVMPALIALLPPRLYDFSYYYVAALALRENPRANLYDPRVLPAVAQAHHLFYGAGQFGYPLLLPIALIPLAALSYATAARIWFSFNLLLWLLNTALLIGWLREGLRGLASLDDGDTLTSLSGGVRRARAWWSGLSDAARFTLVVGLFVCVSYAPIIEAQTIGQASMLMLTCFLLIPWLMRRGYDEVAGFLLAVVILIKLFPAFLLLYLVLRGRWRAVVGAAVSLVALLGGMALVVGVSGVLTMRSLFSVISGGSLATYLNESLARIPWWLSIELGGQPGAGAALVGDALIALVALGFTIGMVISERRRRHAANVRGVDDDLAYGWAICTMLLVIPISQEHYDSWLLPALLLCLGLIAWRWATADRELARHRVRAVALAAGVFFALALTFGDLPYGYDGALTLSLGPYVFGHPLRPVFMLLRPIGALLIWIVAGALLLFPQPANQGVQRAAERGVQPAAAPLIADIPWQPLRLVILGLLGALLIVRLFVLILGSAAVATPK